MVAAVPLLPPPVTFVSAAETGNAKAPRISIRHKTSIDFFHILRIMSLLKCRVVSGIPFVRDEELPADNLTISNAQVFR